MIIKPRVRGFICVTALPAVLNAVITGFAGLVFTLRRVFYKNWKLIQ